MKKLILILLLVPLFSFSQTLVNNVSRMSYLDTPKNIHKTTEVLSNMSIYIESGYLFIKDDIETLKYKIVKIHSVEVEGKKENVYEVLIGKEKHLASVSNYQNSRALLLESIDDTDVTFFYEKRG